MCSKSEPGLPNPINCLGINSTTRKGILRAFGLLIGLLIARVKFRKGQLVMIHQTQNYKNEKDVGTWEYNAVLKVESNTIFLVSCMHAHHCCH